MNYSPISQQVSDSLRHVRELASVAETLAKDVLFAFEGPQEVGIRLMMNKAAKALCAVHCVNHYHMPKFGNSNATAEEYVETFFNWLDDEVNTGVSS